MQRSHAFLWLFGHLLALGIFASRYVYADPNVQDDGYVCVIKEADVDSTGYAAGYYLSKELSPKDMIDQIQQSNKNKSLCHMYDRKSFMIKGNTRPFHYESVPFSYFNMNWTDRKTLSKIATRGTVSCINYQPNFRCSEFPISNSPFKLKYQIRSRTS